MTNLSQTEEAWEAIAGDFWRSDTFGSLFCEAVASNSKRSFIRTLDDACYTYGEAAICVAQIMERLEQSNVSRGDYVACYTEKTVPLILFYLACALMGVVPAPLSNHFSTRYLGLLLDAIDAKAILVDSSNLDKLADFAQSTFCFGPAEASARENHKWLELDSQLTAAEAVATICRLRVTMGVQDPFMVQPTSGSSGAPKLVLRQHAGFVRYAKFVGDEIGRDRERPHVFLAVQALTHAFGLHCLATAMSISAEVALPRNLDTNASLLDVWELRPSILPMVPRVLRSFYRQHLRDLASSPEREFFPPSAEFVLSAGGKSDPKILGYCFDKGIDVLEYYGSSEASIIALTPRGAWKRGQIGKVVADADVKLRSDGEVLVKSPGVMLCYYRQEELTRNAMTDDGYYKTGDIARLSNDGYLQISGRKKDIFNTPEGANIFPARIEDMIESTRWARQAILVGDQRPYLTAYIVVDDSSLVSREKDGYISSKDYEGVYTRLGLDLESINQQVERTEQVVYFMLFSTAFSGDFYKTVGQGKVSRVRKLFEEAYDSRISVLYARSLQFQGECRRVPQSDRRLRSASRQLGDISGLVRAHPRISCDLAVDVIANRGNSKDVLPSRIVDLSLGGAALVANLDALGGAAFRSKADWPRGQILMLRLKIAGGQIELSCEVRWSNGERIGVQFQNRTSASKKAILELFNELSIKTS